jgi:phosphoenolpyruvate-protein phosphotransferase (PTS system enzyme I)
LFVVDDLTVPASQGRHASVKLAGAPIAPGLAMGRVALVGDILECRRPSRREEDRDPDGERRRIESAFAAARGDLAEAVVRLEREVGAGIADVFRAHQMMLDSIRSSGEMATHLRDPYVDAAAAVRRVFRSWIQKFEALRDSTFQQRADDVADLGRRVLRHLEGDEPYRLTSVPEGAVVAARRILPSDVITLADRRVAAILVDSLGNASHAALLAREKSIPTIAVAGVLEHLHDGDEVLVDAYGGSVVVGADAATHTEFEQRVLAYGAQLARCHVRCHEPARTLDGTVIRVEANVGTRRDVDLVLGNGGDGVGLFRIEQLYLGRELPPTEDELYEELQATASPLRDRPLTIRLLDVGGDKPLPFLRPPSEANPSLGLRGIRLLLKHPALLKTQLAALIRLSRAHDVRVLVPLVTLEEDIRATRELFEETCAAVGVTKRPPFGAMIETPAAALSIPAIARHVDFLSVGTNDLTQYTFAAGRDDPNVNEYFQDGHESLLRLLQIIVADAADLPLTLCGELAGREELLPRLLAIGFRSISIAPPLIPAMKDCIRSLRLAG